MLIISFGLDMQDNSNDDIKNMCKKVRRRRPYYTPMHGSELNTCVICVIKKKYIFNKYSIKLKTFKERQKQKLYVLTNNINADNIDFQWFCSQQIMSIFLSLQSFWIKCSFG